jgi:two-component system sensor histidine kinase BaeS
MRRIPLHRSIVARLLATSTLVAICAITGTAWLAVHTTTEAIQQDQVRSFTDDRAVDNALVGYAATHTGWDQVAPLLTELAGRTGSRITLLTQDRRPIAVSGPGPSLVGSRPTATVDALRVDTGQRFDPRVVGPYRLPAAERDALVKRAEDVAGCLADRGIRAQLVQEPSGRPTLLTTGHMGTMTDVNCGLAQLSAATGTEQKALDDLSSRVRKCLNVPPTTPVFIQLPDFTAQIRDANLSYADVDACMVTAREEQLRPYAAPPALLYVTDSAGRPKVFTLSRPNLARIIVVTGAVLAVTMAFAVFAALRLTLPLRALTETAEAPIGTRRPMPVTSRDEIGHLATVLNDLSERRDRAERQRQAMVSDIAHELRNPMTNIRSLLEAAEDGVTPTDGRLVALLLDESAQLSRILDDLHDLAAADAGTLRIHPEPVRLGDVLGAAVEACRGAGEGRDLVLTPAVEGELIIVADPVRMRQVVGNLLSNAIRYTPAGGTVELRAEVVGEELTITVADTGTGIAPDDLPHIFDRFWRADHSRQRATGGSGLGLAIVRDLVRAHGGTVEVTSAINEGTTVTVRIPAGRATNRGSSDVLVAEQPS